MIEELVNELAEWQVEMASISDKIAGDKLIQERIAVIAELEKQASDRRDALHDLVSAYGQDSIDERMEEIKTKIVDEWDPETMKKTLEFDAGTLRFRTTQSLDIKDPALVLTGLLDHTSVKDITTNYITGFKKTSVKKFMSVIPLPMGAAELESKTTVKLDHIEEGV